MCLFQVSPMGIHAGLHDRRRDRRADRLPHQCRKGGSDSIDKNFMFGPSRHGQKNTIRAVPAIEKLDKIFALKSRDSGRRARVGPTQRMSTPEIKMKEIMHEVIGRILDLRNFLTDDRTFSLNFLLGKTRM